MSKTVEAFDLLGAFVVVVAGKVPFFPSGGYHPKLPLEVTIGKPNEANIVPFDDVIKSLYEFY